MEQITKEKYFENWTPEQLGSVSEEQQDEIFQFFQNRKQCYKRDNYKCQNVYCTQEYDTMLLEDRKKHMECHHVIPRRDFKENPTLSKRLGYTVHDLINLAVLCRSCHKGYERALYTIKLDGQEYKLEKPASYDFKKLVREGKELRKRLKRAGDVGWCNITEEEQIILICLLMKWISGDIVHELSDLDASEM